MMYKTLFFGVISLLYALSSSAQEVTYFVSRDAQEFAPKEWRAKWICLPDVTHEDKNHVMLTRRSFEMDEVAQEARLYITAESHYELWVNEQFVSRGPARCDSHHQSYDVLDIAQFLKAGKNTIAIKVHFHGVMKSYYSDTYPGLLVQLEVDDDQLIASDKNWKVQQDMGWDSRTEWVSRINGNNFTSFYDFNKQDQNWRLVNFDDSEWDNAVYQLGVLGWPFKPADYEPYAIRQPWYSLVPRDLPQLIEYDKDAYKVAMQFESPQFSKLGYWTDRKPYDALHSLIQDIQKPIEKTKIENVKAFLNGKKNLKITDSYPTDIFKKEAVYHATIVFDFEEVIDGYPYLQVKGAKGAIIDINYAPYLIEGNYVSSVIMNKFADRILLSGDTDHWLGSEIRTVRYMAVTVRSDAPVEFESIGIRVTEYPFEKQQTIEVAEEPFIPKLWTACEKTLQSITTDSYTDNYHERRQYVQTSYYASLGNYGVHGDTWLQRRYLVQHAQNQLPNGMMPMWAPWGIYEESNQMPGIYEANHFWLMALRDYYLYSGDETTIRELLPNAEKLAQAMNQIQFKDNLVYLPAYDYWIDWAKLSQGEQNFIVNALQLISFQYYAELLNWLDEKETSVKWATEANKIKTALTQFCSDGTGLFADNRNKGTLDRNFSEHANALAIISGVATKAQSEQIIKKIIANREEKHMEESVLFNYWVVEAICRMGHVKEGVDFLKKKYAHMLQEGEPGTLWEYANLYAENVGERFLGARDKFKGRSWCTAQGENGFPGITLSRWILGLHPTTPGMKEISISSFLSPYSSFSGVLPTPNGIVKVERKKDELHLTIPEGIKGIIPSASFKQAKKININEQDISPVNGREDITLEEGEYRIRLIN